MRVVSFNTVEGWSREADVAEELPRRCDSQQTALCCPPSGLRNPSKRQSLDSRQALKWSANSALSDSATTSDIQIANAVAEHAGPRTERAAEFLTWGADEHVLLAIAAGWWLYRHGRPPRERKNSDHVLLTTLVVSAVPHLLKSIFDQRRPDRLTLRGHLHGVPLSGKPLDAFPSGHAMHVGALVSAATVLSRNKAQFRLDIWRQLGPDPDRPARTLGERRRRGPCARCISRAAAASAHRIRRILPARPSEVIRELT